ncbi:MAG: ABC transporter permease, partial [Candidatus Hydrothermarchaeales archaeon]
MVKISPYKKIVAENWNLFKKNRIGIIGVALLIFFGIMALLAPLPKMIDEMYDPMTGTDPEISFSAPPSLVHPLGTDFM